jgi:hypothetical protein
MNVRTFAISWLSAAFAATILFAETSPGSSVSSKDTQSTPRSLSAIQTDVSASLRAEALTRRAGDNTPQVVRLIDLYREMAGHPQRDKSATLKELGQQLRSRLITVHDHIQRQLTDAKNSAKHRKVAAATALPKQHVVAQQLPPGAGPANQAAGAAGARTVATPTDFGPELVELIEATISPETWNINGGNSAIVYYSPLHVLVVSAPGEIHAQVGDAIGQLHAAQRQIDGVQVAAEVGLARAANK